MPDDPFKCCNGLVHEQYPQNCNLYARAGSVLSPTFGPDFSGAVSKMKPIKKTDEPSAPEPLLDLMQQNKPATKPPAELENLVPQEPAETPPPEITPQAEPRGTQRAPATEAPRRDRQALRPVSSTRRPVR